MVLEEAGEGVGRNVQGLCRRGRPDGRDHGGEVPLAEVARPPTRRQKVLERHRLGNARSQKSTHGPVESRDVGQHPEKLGPDAFRRWAKIVLAEVAFHSMPVVLSETEKLMSDGLVGTPSIRTGGPVLGSSARCKR